jgi:NAD(P)-dependent dehydrogenase (short-subunit alcohol dehydrogenase family)
LIDAAARRVGPRVDIIINNAEVHGGPAVSPAAVLELAQAEMNTNYFGLVRLASGFVPHLLARAHEATSRPSAWVNVLSIHALSAMPADGTFAASKSAALSFARCLRAQLRSAGMRVLNVFPGPLDEPAFRDVPPPKLAHNALARSIVEALASAQEDCYPGDVAQDFLRRWRLDPKVLELELQP